MRKLRKLRKLPLLAVVVVAAMSAAPRGAPAASPDGTAPAAAGRPVLLADAQEFEARPAPAVGQDEIAEARRMLASAVASEKFMAGAAAAAAAWVFVYLAF